MMMKMMMMMMTMMMMEMKRMPVSKTRNYFPLPIFVWQPNYAALYNGKVFLKFQYFHICSASLNSHMSQNFCKCITEMPIFTVKPLFFFLFSIVPFEGWIRQNLQCFKSKL